MSQMRQKFCDIHGLMFHDDCDDHPEFESFTLGYQAATEATEDIGLAAPNEPKPCRACDPSVGFICEEHGESEVEAEADAYNHACELMEQGWKERAKRGVEIGTEGSLCDGIAWIFDRMKKLETEAAKATGTAGEHSHQGNRYGNLTDAEYIEMTRQEAARQPATVLAVSLTTDQKRELLKCLNGGVEMGWIEQNNALEISSSILAGAQDQKLPVLPVKTWQERMGKSGPPITAMQAEIADLRAALAATAAPVLSDERIDWLANCACPGGIAYPSQVKTAIRDALREAATNRSQP